MLTLVSTAYAADGEGVEYESNPEDMPLLSVRPSAFYSAEGYTGLLDTVSYTTNKSFPNLYDNNLETHQKILGNDNYTITFDQPHDIKSFYMKLGPGSWAGSPNRYSVSYYNSQGNLIVRTDIDNTRLHDNQIHAMPSVANGVKKVVLEFMYPGHYLFIREFELFENKVYYSVSDITSTTTFDKVVLKWVNPKNAELVDVQVNGKSIGKVQTFTENGLKPGEEYEYKITAVYSDGTLIDAIYKTATKEYVDVDIVDLKATPSHDRVDLSWKLPSDGALKHVNIYREKKTSFFSEILVETAYAAGTKIFETNGTYFNDLTVSADTKYEYTLTTQSSYGTESPGVKIEVKTAKAPPPDQIEGDGWEKDPNGDYLYKWTSPTTGTVKVMVGGKEFKVVAASDLKILIPKADMKFTVLGAPDVYLIPIGEDGAEGVPTKPPSSGGEGGTDIPFSPNDLLKSGMGLLWVVGPFVLLALAFLLVPKLRNMAIQAFNQRKGQPTTTGRRFNS